MIDAPAEEVFEGGLAGAGFLDDAGLVLLREAQVAFGVGADGEAQVLHFAELGGVHQRSGFGADAGVPAGGGADEAAHRIDGGRVAVSLEHRGGVFEEVHVGVVEGEHQRAGRQRRFAAQPGGDFVETDHPIAEQLEHRHLRLEARQVAIQRAVGLHAAGEVADPVIHQDVHARHARPPQASR